MGGALIIPRFGSEGEGEGFGKLLQIEVLYESQQSISINSPLSSSGEAFRYGNSQNYIGYISRFHADIGSNIIVIPQLVLVSGNQIPPQIHLHFTQPQAQGNGFTRRFTKPDPSKEPFYFEPHGSLSFADKFRVIQLMGEVKEVDMFNIGNILAAAKRNPDKQAEVLGKSVITAIGEARYDGMMAMQLPEKLIEAVTSIQEFHNQNPMLAALGRDNYPRTVLLELEAGGIDWQDGLDKLFHIPHIDVIMKEKEIIASYEELFPDIARSFFMDSFIVDCHNQCLHEHFDMYVILAASVMDSSLNASMMASEMVKTDDIGKLTKQVIAKNGEAIFQTLEQINPEIRRDPDEFKEKVTQLLRIYFEHQDRLDTGK